MWERSNVDDFGYFDTGAVDGADSGFAAVARTFYISLNFAETEVVSDLCAVLGSHLSGVGSVLFRTAESHFTGA